MEEVGLPSSSAGAPQIVVSKDGHVGRLRTKLAELGVAELFGTIHFILHQ